MRTVIVAVGRWKKGPERALYDAYVRRLRPVPELIEVEEKRSRLPVPARIAAEGALQLARIPAESFVVALDGRGKTLSSEDLAARLGALRDGGMPAVTFVIGGADGLAAEVLARADLVLSLGAMTWPHLLVRTLLAEQLYRAEAILAGHPYHRAGPPPT